MHQIHKTITLPIDGSAFTFRLCKLDAFSGAQLLQMIRKHLPDAPSTGGQTLADLIDPIFLALSPEELRNLMTSCLSHTEVLLDAGYQPVMQLGEWSWPDIEHDTPAALKLTLQSVLWSLDGFFTAAGSTSRPAETPQG